MIVDIERRAGLHVITSGTRLGWLVVVWMVLSVSLRASSVCLYDKKNVTRYLEDMNFMF